MKMFKRLPQLHDTQETQASSSKRPQQEDREQRVTRNNSSIFCLPPVSSIEAPNSTIVRQRVSAKDFLAAATVAAGASLPLMIGGRPESVLNLREQQQQPQSQIHVPIEAQAQTQVQNPSGPQNTALRAEQRRQNMISVVRPVMSHAERQVPSEEFLRFKASAKSGVNSDESEWASNELAREACYLSGGADSIMDDFMKLDAAASRDSLPTQTIAAPARGGEFLIFGGGSNDALFINRDRKIMQDEYSEQNARQQLILFRREEFELNRSARRQHKFVLAKIDERKRHLQVIQSIWAQKDFRTAMEKLVDFYHCGLVCLARDDPASYHQNSSNSLQASDRRRVTLSSLQTPLFVDVIGMIVLRPKLWSLEICQLVLPIIVNDLLGQSAKYENYIEVALKSLRLIVSCFSPVIKSTLEASGLSAAGAAVASGCRRSQRGSLGVDLSHEDRHVKCLNCYKLLLEAQSLISKRCSSLAAAAAAASGRLDQAACARLLPVFRELNHSLLGLIHSLEPEPHKLLGLNDARKHGGSTRTN